MINDLLKTIEAHGDMGAVVPFVRIEDLKQDMRELKNGDYHPDWLDRMAKHITGDENKFVPSGINFQPRSLISIIMYSPKVMLRFNYRGRVIHCAVPPHFTNWYQKNEQALQYINDYLAPHGFSAATAVSLPQKLLAVHCGLSLYGRNNICYSSKYGSHMQIMTYISDLPCEEAPWYPIRRMEMCESCSACVSSCPTGAIDSSRRLVNSDRCITFFTELPNVEFPEWIDKDAHNSVVGCTKCQDCCPGNAQNKVNETMGVEFTEEETAELLNHKDGVPYSSLLAARIEATGILPEDCVPGVFPRNIQALFRKEG